MTVRAVFWKETQAALVAGRLTSDGFTAETVSDGVAGEDEDDVTWAVITDAPATMVELLAEKYDGWLDDELS